MTKNTPMSLIDMNESEIEEFIAKHLPVKVLEKKKYGEVFTPSALIKKILDFFPKSVWSNPDLKWLDPSCGTGNFMILVYQRLMLGLKFESEAFGIVLSSKDVMEGVSAFMSKRKPEFKGK